MSLEKRSQAQTPRIYGEKRRLRGLESFSLLKDSLKAGNTCPLGTGRLIAPHTFFPSNSAGTIESLLKGKRWTMVRALGSSNKSLYHEHSLRPIVFD